MSDDTPKVSVDDEKALDTKDNRKPLTGVEKEEEEAASKISRAKNNQELSMRVKVYSPSQDYFDGQAFSLSAENLTGPFDILPKHHNFITLLSPCDLVVRTTADDSEAPIHINISGGILHVKADSVIVFLDV